MKKFLELPKTLRVPKPNEVPMNSSVLERLKQRENANIVEGFTFKYKDDNEENTDLKFNFYSEINIDNSKLWSVVLKLANTFPKNISFLFGFIDFEINYGNYVNKEILFNFISKYEQELTQDTFLVFGFIYHTDDELVELFVDESKYIKYWGTNEQEFRDILEECAIYQTDDLEFVDEYPKVRESLKMLDKNVVETDKLIEVFKEKYL